MIVITGATGQLGSQVVERLLDRVPAEQVGVSVRDPAAAAGLAARGVRVRRGRLRRAATLDAAFEGATQVLVVSANTLGPGAVTQHRAAIDAAVAGRGRAGPLHQPPGRRGRLALRPGPRPRGDRGAPGVGRGRVHLAAGRVPRRDGAAPARPGAGDRRAGRAGRRAGVLDHPRRPRRRRGGRSSPTATGPRRTPPPDGGGGGRPRGRGRPAVRADRAHRAAGRRRPTRTTSPASTGHGVPEAAARTARCRMFRAARAGEFAVTDPTLATLLGRPTQPLRAVLAAAVPVS